jgi:hypothetical protein
MAELDVNALDEALKNNPNKNELLKIANENKKTDDKKEEKKNTTSVASVKSTAKTESSSEAGVWIQPTPDKKAEAKK